MSISPRGLLTHEMGCCTYFGLAALVGSLSWGSYYWITYVGLPDWYWQARLPPDVEQIDVSDTVTLKKILFSGEPWLLQCYSSLPYLGQHLPAPYRVDETFTQSLASMRGLVRGGMIDCEKPLPSNKSMVNKFGLVRRTQPLLIFASAGAAPKQVPAKSVGSAYALTAWVKPKAEPHVRSITSQKQLQGYCGGRRTCLITRLPADSLILEQLARSFRTVEVLSLGEVGGKVSLSWGRGAEVGSPPLPRSTSCQTYTQTQPFPTQRKTPLLPPPPSLLAPAPPTSLHLPLAMTTSQRSRRSHSASKPLCGRCGGACVLSGWAAIFGRWARRSSQRRRSTLAAPSPS